MCYLESEQLKLNRQIREKGRWLPATGHLLRAVWVHVPYCPRSQPDLIMVLGVYGHHIHQTFILNSIRLHFNVDIKSWNLELALIASNIIWYSIGICNPIPILF